jgi:hypothetical protein
MHFRHLLSVPSRLVGLAQAARPLAGGSPSIVRDQSVQCGRSVAALGNCREVWHETEHKSELRHARLL